jgi:class III poly(R)-hydroxyalkanoic acid synthase PhaE subunit
MTDTDDKDTPWLSEWLEQQRAILKHSAADPGDESSAEALREAAQRFFRSGTNGSPSTSENSADPASAKASFAPFAVGEELLQIWRKNWNASDAIGRAAATSFSELIKQVPTLGIAREEAESWRNLAAAQAECHVLEERLRGMLLDLHKESLDLLERRLSKGERRVQSFRDFYNLWVECAEELYAALAHSEAFAKLQADLGNASLRLRARQQKIVEQTLKQWDLPTRSELNSVHLKLQELKRSIDALGPARRKPAKRKAASTGARAKSKRKTRR